MNKKLSIIFLFWDINNRLDSQSYELFCSIYAYFNDRQISKANEYQAKFRGFSCDNISSVSCNNPQEGSSSMGSMQCKQIVPGSETIRPTGSVSLFWALVDLVSRTEIIVALHMHLAFRMPS